MRTLGIAMRKGGIGKTTLTRELSTYLAMQGRSVLIIGIDSQECITRDLGPREAKKTLLDIIKTPTQDTVAAAVTDTSVSIPGEGYIDMVPYSDDLIEIDPYIESIINDGGDGQRILARALATIDGVYDDVIIDFSTTISRLSDMAMTAASPVYQTGPDPSGLVYPVTPDQVYNADISRTSTEARALAHVDIHVPTLGVVINKYYRRRSRQLEKNFEELAARSDCLGVIPDRVAAMSEVRNGENHTPEVLAHPTGDIARGVREVAQSLTPSLMRG